MFEMVGNYVFSYSLSALVWDTFYFTLVFFSNHLKLIHKNRIQIIFFCLNNYEEEFFVKKNNKWHKNSMSTVKYLNRFVEYIVI